MSGVSVFVACAVLLLSGCVSAPSLDSAQQSTSTEATASKEQYVDACAITTTGADRNGQRFPKEVIRAIKTELDRQQVDCDAYASPTIANNGTQAPTASAPSLSFQE
jgi:hypothetical protein